MNAQTALVIICLQKARLVLLHTYFFSRSLGTAPREGKEKKKALKSANAQIGIWNGHTDQKSKAKERETGKKKERTPSHESMAAMNRES